MNCTSKFTALIKTELLLASYTTHLCYAVTCSVCVLRSYTLAKVRKLILKFIKRIGKLAPVYRQSFFCSAVLTPQHYHWYAATRFAVPGG